ncbi:uncharacterized protein LOC114247605 [Bombyx mandarina]|uniref:Uncharacterized protein LOC114247605 n=1 Tax=Bombyx mandarina TaxID=7092 RepID=A0A6J2K475_BOMMA|nr:uncharacterized protein LOC114247605 [Bombyx mandarina]
MLQFVLLLVVAAAASENCSFYFDGQPYSRTAILSIKGLPTNLVYNPANQDLLFTLIDLETLQDDNIQTKMDQYILREGNTIKIDNVRGQASAVDMKRNKVYIASDDGLNELNSTDKANFVGLKDDDIVQLYKPRHGDELYAVLFPENAVYIIDIEKDEKRKVEYIPCAFYLGVDDKDNIFYECDSKYVKVLLKGFQEPIEFVGIAKNSGKAIAVDGIGRVILAATDGLYHLRPDNVIPNKLMELDFYPSGIAFNEVDNRMYLSTNDVIYRYNPCFPFIL